MENGLILRKWYQGLLTRDDDIMSPSMVVNSNVLQLYISCFIMGLNGLYYGTIKKIHMKVNFFLLRVENMRSGLA